LGQPEKQSVEIACQRHIVAGRSAMEKSVASSG